MRIRKRSQSVAATPPQLPISCKCQQQPGDVVMRRSKVVAECSNMQEARRLERVTDAVQDGDDHESPQSSSDVFVEPLVMENLSPPDAHDVKRDSDGDLSEHERGTDKGRRSFTQSPTKRRKIEHESDLLFEGSSSMTAAELLVVNELANGVRQRLAASEQSTSEQATKALTVSRPAENSKDALISSIFYVFDTCGENGLSASEVVKYMLEQRLPGLKEGGARHTVQVANVLRSSSSFISLGDKKYLLCSTLDGRNKKPAGSTRQTPAKTTTTSPVSSDDQTLNPKPQRRGTSKQRDASRSNNRKPEKPKPRSTTPQAQEEEPHQQGSSDGGEPVVRVARRRGPSSSQKGKGPTQCKRYDGRGWQCSRLTEPGYSLCVHHQDLINKRAAKLKEQQTLTRLMESVNRKAKNQPTTPTENPNPSETTDSTLQQHETEPENGNAPNLKLKIVLSNKDREKDAAPVQKRKMLSLMAIKHVMI